MVLSRSTSGSCSLSCSCNVFLSCIQRVHLHWAPGQYNGWRDRRSVYEGWSAPSFQAGPSRYSLGFCLPRPLRFLWGFLRWTYTVLSELLASCTDLRTEVNTNQLGHQEMLLLAWESGLSDDLAVEVPREDTLDGTRDLDLGGGDGGQLSPVSENYKMNRRRAVKFESERYEINLNDLNYCHWSHKRCRGWRLPRCFLGISGTCPVDWGRVWSQRRSSPFQNRKFFRKRSKQRPFLIEKVSIQKDTLRLCWIRKASSSEKPRLAELNTALSLTKF